MILKTRQAGDPVLRRKAKEVIRVELKSAKIQALIDSMVETLRDHPGVGLAAPQVGENLRILIVEDLPKYHAKLNKKLVHEQGREPIDLTVLINPRLTITNVETVSYFEGCLSVPGYRAIVPRAKSVKVTGLDRNGDKLEVTATGWYARILQHEVAHLSGELYIDVMNFRSFMNEKEYAHNWSDKLAKDLDAFQRTAEPLIS